MKNRRPIYFALLYYFALFVYIVLCTAKANAQNTLSNDKSVNLNSTGFTENKGQIVDQNYKPNPGVKYLLCTPGFNVQLRQTGFSYDTYTPPPTPASPPSKGGSKEQSPIASQLPPLEGGEAGLFHYHRVDISLIGCNSHTQMVAEGKSKAYYNYFTAGTPKGGVSYVHSYQKVIYKNIYPKIDLVASLNLSKGETSTSANTFRGGFEYFFVIHPGGNPSDIKLQYKGANSVKLENNKLVVNVTAGNFSENIPSSYLQDPISGVREAAVSVNYASLGNNTFGFSLPKLPLQGGQRGAALIIDPTPNLDWGTYYGGNAIEYGWKIALDVSDNEYISGFTASTNNIATAGAYQTTYGGGTYDALVAKFNPTGSSLLWGTYYGGSGLDDALAIALDASDNVYITGYTNSTGNIATAGAYQTAYGGGTYDAFVAKFNSTGSSLLWGTYYGGTTWDGGFGITIDASDNAYITGSTNSTNGIATAGAYQTTLMGSMDNFVAKFNSTGSSLLWGTYYGHGGANDQSYDVVLDASDNVYITGQTSSTSGIATAGAYQTIYGGGTEDVFVAKFNPSGSSLLWGTYYGGSGNDYGYGIALDALDNVFITGNTTSTNAIATAGAYQTTFGGGYDAYVAKFNSVGSSLLWGTYYGGSGYDQGNDIILDASDNSYITGTTASASGIATAGAYQTVYGGGTYDALVAKFNSAGSSLLWGTYYGGSTDDYGEGIALNGTDNIYITGITASINAIATVGAYQTVYGGGPYDAIVAKFDSNQTCQLTSLSTSFTKDSLCSGDSATLSVTPVGSSTVKYLWSPGGQTTQTIHVTPASTTTYTVTVNDTVGGCFKTDSVKITVNPLPVISFSGNDSICEGNSVTITASGGTNYLWNTGATTSAITVQPLSDSTYTVTVSNSGCDTNGSFHVTVDPIPSVILNTPAPICKGDSITLTANGGAGTSYAWSTGATSNAITVTPDSTTTYSVSVTNSTGCVKDTSIAVIVNPLPAVTLSGDSSICTGDSTTITATGGGTYLWGNGSTNASTLFKPASTTTYTLQVSNSNGCTKDTSITIIVDSIPIPAISGTQNICSGEQVTLIASGGAMYSWSNGETSSAINITPVSTATYTVTVANGSCTAKDSIKVTVNPVPSATACCNATITLGGDTTLMVLSNDTNDTYSWSPSAGLSCTTCPTPTASPTATTWYYVTVTDSEGCSTTDSVLITVKENCGSIYLPNAFSPNNDGYNDVLYVYGNCIQSMDLNIYDRWGNKVFESKSESIGWDGTYHGQPMNTGTYVYTLTVTDFNNNTTTKKGNVSLIR